LIGKKVKNTRFIEVSKVVRFKVIPAEEFWRTGVEEALSRRTRTIMMMMR